MARGMHLNFDVSCHKSFLLFLGSLPPYPPTYLPTTMKLAFCCSCALSFFNRFASINQFLFAPIHLSIFVFLAFLPASILSCSWPSSPLSRPTFVSFSALCILSGRQVASIHSDRPSGQCNGAYLAPSSCHFIVIPLDVPSGPKIVLAALLAEWYLSSHRWLSLAQFPRGQQGPFVHHPSPTSLALSEKLVREPLTPIPV